MEEGDFRGSPSAYDDVEVDGGVDDGGVDCGCGEVNDDDAENNDDDDDDDDEVTDDGDGRRHRLWQHGSLFPFRPSVVGGTLMSTTLLPGESSCEDLSDICFCDTMR